MMVSLRNGFKKWLGANIATRSIYLLRSPELTSAGRSTNVDTSITVMKIQTIHSVSITWVDKTTPLRCFCGIHEADLGIPQARSEARDVGPLPKCQA